MILTIITFILILGLLVFVHELGHFITARRAGVKVDEFGFGFPPRAMGVYKDPTTKKWNFVGSKTKEAPATIYSINYLPLGGFVKIKGEQGENAQDPDSFGHKSIGQRIFILSSGVLMNVILTFALLSIGFKIGLPQIIEDIDLKNAKVRNEKIQIVDVLVGLPAQKQGLQLGDTILSVDGTLFTQLEELQGYLHSKIGISVKFQLKRGNEVIEKYITPEKILENEKGGIGVGLVKTGIVSYPIFRSIFKGAETTLFLTKEIILAFYTLIKNLIISRSVTVDISGPVGIAIITGQVTKMGIIYILQFAALLSLNLAIINFLPIPALDGGRVLFLVLEKMRGKPISPKIEASLHNLGFILLMVLVVLVTFRDIFRFSDSFVGLWKKVTELFY